MLYFLFVFFHVNGELQVQAIEQPSYQTCLSERDIWLKSALKRDPEASAGCVVQEAQK